MNITAMKQALEALDGVLKAHRLDERSADDRMKIIYAVSDAEKAILDLRQAIEQAEKMEPFGIWHQGATEEESDFFLFKDAGDVSCPDCIKLYTNPPTATLTSEMLIEAALSASAAGLLSGTINWAKHVQRKLLVKQPTTPVVGNTTCNPHPDAPHGFNHSASHLEGRYVCKCEGWMPPVRPLTCTWTEDAEGYYSTECGEAYVFNDGTPAQNNAVYCHHCGGKIVMGEPL